jgi:hypothetical protein
MISGLQARQGIFNADEGQGNLKLIMQIFNQSLTDALFRGQGHPFFTGGIKYLFFT